MPLAAMAVSLWRFGGAWSVSQKLVYLDGVTLPDLLWAGEQALSCASVACSLLASSDSAPDFTHSRRLSLAARNAERPLILALGSTGASAATTRWRIALCRIMAGT